MIEIELFDGTILEFPAGTADDVIDRIAREQTFARTAPNAPATSPIPPERPFGPRPPTDGAAQPEAPALPDTAMPSLGATPAAGAAPSMPALPDPAFNPGPAAPGQPAAPAITTGYGPGLPDPMAAIAAAMSPGAPALPRMDAQPLPMPIRPMAGNEPLGGGNLDLTRGMRDIPFDPRALPQPTPIPPQPQAAPPVARAPVDTRNMPDVPFDPAALPGTAAMQPLPPVQRPSSAAPARPAVNTRDMPDVPFDPAALPGAGPVPPRAAGVAPVLPDDPSNPPGTLIGRGIERGILRTRSTFPQMEAVSAASRAEDALGGPQNILNRVFRMQTGLSEVPPGLDISTPEKMLEAMERMGFPVQARMTAYNTAIERIEAASQMTPADAAALIQGGAEAQMRATGLQRRASEIPMHPATDRLLALLDEQPDEFWPTVQTLGLNPVETAALIADLGAESLPQIGAAIVTGLATRNPAVGALVMGAGTVAQEYGSSVDEFLTENGVQLETPEDAQALIQNADLMAKANARGLTRGLVIAAMEVVGQGIAGATLASGPVANALLQSGAQAATGAGGEALARAASGQDFSAREVVLEGIAELGTAPAEVAAAAVASAREKRDEEQASPTPPAPPPQAGTPPAPPVAPAPAPAPEAAPAAPPAPEPDQPPTSEAAPAQPEGGDRDEGRIRNEEGQRQGRQEVTPITRAEAEAQPDRFEIVDEAEGQGADWQQTGRQVVVDRQTGQVRPLADTDEAAPAGGAPEPSPASTQPQVSVAPERGPDNAPAAGGARPGQVQSLTSAEVASIGTDAATFQYKDGGDEQGVTERLRGVDRWDEMSAGIGLVYEYADGRRVIVDGHQRLGLARALQARGQDTPWNVRVLREADGITPSEARRIAAMVNIRNNSGSSLDAAKVLRETGDDPRTLGLPMQSAMVRDAVGLSRLSDDAFGMVINERATQAQGGLVGRLVDDRAVQADILGLLARLKPGNAFQAEAIVRQAMAATETSTQTDLFGSQQVTESLYRERAAVLDAAAKKLRSEKRLFQTLTDRATAIEAAGNVLASDENSRRAQSDAMVLEYLTRQANTKGPISDALTAAARAVKSGTRLGVATDSVVEAVRAFLEGTGPDRAGTDPGRTEVAPPEGAGTPAVQPEVAAPAPEPQVDAPTTEPGADGRPQLVMPGMEPSADQATQAAGTRAQAEADTKKNQSKIRTSKPQKDAGPLFDTQGNMLDAPAPTPAPKRDVAAIVAEMREFQKAFRARHERDDDGPRNRASKSKDLIEDRSADSLLEALARAEGFEARKEAANRWVSERGIAGNVEVFAALDADGNLLGAFQGIVDSVSPFSFLWRAALAGEVAHNVHNHPPFLKGEAAGPSPQDIAAAHAGLSPMTIMMPDGSAQVVAVRDTGMRDRLKRKSSGMADLPAEALDVAWKSVVMTEARGAVRGAISRNEMTREQADLALVRAQTYLYGLFLDRLGLIDYTIPVSASVAEAQIAETGLTMREIYGRSASFSRDWLGRADFRFSPRADRGGNQPAGGAAEAASPDADGADRQPQGDAGGRDGGRGPVATTGDADFDGALDDLFGGDNVPGDGGNLEPGGGSRAPADPVGGTDVQPAGGRDVGGDRGGDAADRGGDGQPDRGGGVDGDGTAPVGAGGDSAASGPDGADGRPAGAGGRGGRSGGGRRRLPAGPRGTRDAAPPAVDAPSRADDARDLNDLFGERVARLEGLAETIDGFDPAKYERAKDIFARNLEGLAVDTMSRQEVFTAMARPLVEAGLTRQALVAMKPYFDRYLSDRTAGRLTPPDDAYGLVWERMDPNARYDAVIRGKLAALVRSGNDAHVWRLADAKWADLTTAQRESLKWVIPEPSAAPKPINAPDRAAQQAAADKIKVRPGDEANIRATLPLLLAEQQDDVVKVESRFAKPDGHGFMLTNGTGTGKTFSGMGVIKRFVQQGKGNILIVAPSEAVMEGWSKAAQAMNVPVNRLADTDSAGEGVTITTFANMYQNNALLTRQFDLVVADEAQNLLSNAAGEATAVLQQFRALTHRPQDLWLKATKLMDAEWTAYKALPDGPTKSGRWSDLDAKRKKLIAELEKQPRAKALFLSASPFAYDKTIDYAEGYLFSYGPPGTVRIGNSNQDARADFFVKHFGYRIRYHKLTKPEAAVDAAVFEREFHEWLKAQGALSGRSLSVAVDYDRKFVLTEDAEGTKLDEALKILDQMASAERKANEGKDRATKPIQKLQDHMRKNFDYLARSKLLEAIKARAVIEDINAHVAMGRKVVVFHDFNVGGGFNPFTYVRTREERDPETGESYSVPVAPMDTEAREGYAALVSEHPWIEDLNFAGYERPVVAIPKALKGARLFNGTVPQKQRLQNLADFNTDGSDVNVLVVQADAGGAGISMHDVTGGHQRVLINLGMPAKPTTTLQQEGRTLRVGSVSDAPFRYYTIGTDWERRAFASRIAERTGTVENLAMGNEARDLLTSFVDAYMEADTIKPSAEDGKGGKARDKKASALSPYGKAKTHYFGRAQMRQRRDQRAGVEFYPTPEPLGFKMAQWAGIRANERVLEPSAGDGAIARYVRDDAALRMIEPSSDLASTAQLRTPHGQIVESRFEDYHISNKHHVVLMNPPFGSGGKTAMEHLEKAMRHTRERGRIVALIPTGPSADKRFAALNLDGWVMTADVALPAVAFERAGTAVAARVVVLDKVDDPAVIAEMAQSARGSRSVNLTGAQSINDFFDRLEGISLPDRAPPVVDAIDEIEAEAAGATPQGVTPTPVAGPVAEVGFSLKEATHGKTGAPLYVATADRRMDPEDYKATLAVAKQHGGWWSSFRGKGAVPGFQFKTKEARQAFLDDMAKPVEGLAETVAYHGSPHDFDRFSLDAIGTGEGAQMFGWGLYFAGRRQIAEHYKRTLSRAALALDGQPAPDWVTGPMTNATLKQVDAALAEREPQKPDEVSPDDWRAGRPLMAVSLKFVTTALRDKVAYSGDDPVMRLNVYRDVALSQYRGESTGIHQRVEAAAKIAAIDWLAPRVSLTNRARLYRVEIPDEANLLDWDAPLNRQPEVVLQAFQEVAQSDAPSDWVEQPATDVTRRAWVDQFGWQIVDFGDFFAVNSPATKMSAGRNMAEKKRLVDAKKTAEAARKSYSENIISGADAYRILSSRMGGDKAASLYLNSLGIPGHRYLDGASRSEGEGSYNYVIYDDSAITILEKQQRARINIEALTARDTIRRVIPKLRAELDRLDLKRVNLRHAEGADWQGAFRVTGSGQMEILIGASLNPMETLHHEAIHAMRAANLFTPTEWRALSLAAEKWLGKYDIEGRYPDLTREQQIEEAIAEEFAQAFAAKKSPQGSALVTAFNKIARLLRALGNVFRGAGFQTAEDVFGRALAGEIGRRDRGGMAAGGAQQRGPDVTQTEAFKRWFGDSKVVDAEGRPLVVYHGTGADFEAFDPALLGSSTGAESARDGFFFSSSTEDAQTFAAKAATGKRLSGEDAAPRVVPAYLSLRNPLVVDRDGNAAAMATLTRRAKANGHDGLIVRNVRDAVRRPVLRVNGKVMSMIDTESMFMSESLPMFLAGNMSRADVQAELDDTASFFREEGTGEPDIDAEIARQWQAVADAWRADPASVVEDLGPTADVFVAFRPEQIKSAFNRGTFDPTDARISYQRMYSPASQAHRRAALGQVPHIPDRRLWAELTRQGEGIWSRLGGGAGAAKDAADRVRFAIQDRFLPVLRAQEAIEKMAGRPLPKDMNAYNAEITYSGKVEALLIEIDEEYTKPIIDLIARTKGGLDADSVGTWLYARHAKERNARIASINPDMPDGGSGLTNDEADAILSAAAAGPHAQALDQIGALVDKLRDRMIDVRVDAGLLAPEDAAYWRTYKHYVPLKGFDEVDHADTTRQAPNIGRRFSIRGPESQRALGRESLAFNPLQQAITQAQEAAIRAEKNRVAVRLYDLAKAHPSPELFETKAPKQKRFYNRTTGLVETRIVQPVGLYMEPNEMAVKVGGKEHRIVFHDPRVQAAAISISADRMSGALRTLAAFARFFSMTRTMLNPEFVITNAIRDVQTGAIQLQATKDGGAIAAFAVANWRKAFVGVWKGQRYSFDKEWAKHYKEFQEAGGKVAFWHIQSPEVDLQDLQDRIRLARGTRAARAFKGMFRASFRDNPALGFIERVNMSVDNAMRLAAFVKARQLGWSAEDAAILSKEMTVNFNRRGMVGQEFNALYPFFNASVQGTHRLLKTMTARRVGAITAVLFAAGLVNELVNAALSDEDDDGELFYDKIPNFRNERNFHMLWLHGGNAAILGNGDGSTAAAMPMAYGFNVFPYAGQQLGKVMRGVKTPGAALRDVAGAIFGAYSPITGSDALTTATPFFLDPFVEMYGNRNFFGGPIYPTEYQSDRYLPDSYTHHASATEISKTVAQAVNAMTGGDAVTPGWFDVSPETLDHLSGFVVGSAGRFYGDVGETLGHALRGTPEQIKTDDIPFVSTVRSEVSEWRARSRYFDLGREVQDARYRARAYRDSGQPVPPEVAALDLLYEDWLKAENERKGQKEFAPYGPRNQNPKTPRPHEEIYRSFARAVLAVTGPQAE